MNLTIPTQLTLLRVLLIPVMVVCFYQPEWGALLATSIFALAGITDWADGYLARKMNQESSFGAFLDPVADKLIVAVALILIAVRDDNVWVSLAAIIIISRELIVSALREWMAKEGQSSKVAVAYIGKLKTTAQIIALLLLLYNQPLLGLPLREIGLIALAVATVFTVVSMMQYLNAAFK